MILSDYLWKRALAYQGGITEGGSPSEEARNTLISSDAAVRLLSVREAGVWYRGSGDELLNFYGKNNAIDYGLEPWYFENKRSFFWTVSSTEKDIKRTHSGQPRNIVDILVGLVDVPTVSVGAAPKSNAWRRSKGPDADETSVLESVLDECGFWEIYSGEQMPMTLVEGWGAYKVAWDLASSDHPYAQYYRAEDVDYVRRGGRVTAMMFKDWYVGEDKTKRYLVTEFRYLRPRKDPKTGSLTRDLVMETDVWIVSGSDSVRGDGVVVPAPDGSVPGFEKSHDVVKINDFGSLLATPCWFYRDATDPKSPGRSVYAGKIELFDDLDQELSQKSNAVRRSTPQELFNSDFLERDPRTHLPRMPRAFDRKYVSFAGGRDANGATNSSEPVQVTQPNLNVDQYSKAAIDTLGQILAGVMSPATMGIGVAAQATQESQREKEKVTISTRNHLIDRETRILKSVFSDLLCAEEYLRTGRILTKSHDVSVTFGEFADSTFEEKSTVLIQALEAGAMSPEMFMDKLYGNDLSDEDRESELEYVGKTHDPDAQGMAAMMGADPEDPEGGPVPPIPGMM